MDKWFYYYDGFWKRGDIVRMGFGVYVGFGLLWNDWLWFNFRFFCIKC